MEHTDIEVRCSRCMGTGLDDATKPTAACLVCAGTGYVKTNRLEITSLIGSLDSIIAEQTALRVDLTASLTAIWNKVKNL